jgi:ribosomal protein L11 methyltransferase
MAADDVTIKSVAQRTVLDSSCRVTPQDLQKSLLIEFPHQLRKIKKAIRDLISEGALTYTYQFGSSFIERSFNKPVKITERIVLTPDAISCYPKDDAVVIRLRSGAAFGSGEHPTTRLGLQGIASVLEKTVLTSRLEKSRALDIGTGTGVLAIAAVFLGIECAIGIDIDPCARAEAETNVRLNRLNHRIRVDAMPLEAVEGPFQLVTANLRSPTLKKMCSNITDMVEPGGFVVLTGYKSQEEKIILASYSGVRLEPYWRADEKDWVCNVLKREAG